MRIGRQQTNPGRWLLVLLAAVVAALAAILVSVTARVAAAVGADTRVGALSVGGVRGAGVDKEFTYGSDAADWVNETMGADPNSLNGIMGQVAFAAVPIGPVGLAGKAASGTRLLRGATPLSRTTKAAKTGDGFLSPGPYAGKSIPGDSTRNWSRQQRDDLNDIMNDTGCHRCGIRDPGTKRGDAIPDHQPPLSQSDGPYQLYPHCLACSREQGLFIASLIRQGGAQ